MVRGDDGDLKWEGTYRGFESRVLCEGIELGELRDQRIFLVEIYLVTHPLADGGKGELLHEDEPVVEVGTDFPLGKTWIRGQVRLLSSRIMKILASGYPGSVFLLK